MIRLHLVVSDGHNVSTKWRCGGDVGGRISTNVPRIFYVAILLFSVALSNSFELNTLVFSMLPSLETNCCCINSPPLSLENFFRFISLCFLINLYNHHAPMATNKPKPRLIPRMMASLLFLLDLHLKFPGIFSQSYPFPQWLLPSALASSHSSIST